MPYHILANTMFNQKNIKSSFAHKLDLQLSALAFCLGSQDDTAVIKFQPSQDYLSHLQKLELPVIKYIHENDLGSSVIVDSWQLISNPSYIQKHPYHSLIEKLSCKAFAAEIHQPQFDHIIVNDLQQVGNFLEKKVGTYVLKLPKSQSGMGHFLIDATSFKPNKHLANLDLKNSRLEKWVDRVFDFSSQWLLSESIELLGICELLNNKQGSYQGSIFPIITSEFSEFIKKHIEFVRPFLEEFYKQGLRGHLGIDAFIYLENHKLHLCPVIEFNPRKTMGYVAVHLANHLKRRVHISIGSYCPLKSLLPPKFTTFGHEITFQKNLNLVAP